MGWWAPFVWAWIALVIAGYYTGRSRGRAAAGVLWTLLLGPIGLAIILSFAKTQTPPSPRG